MKTLVAYCSQTGNTRKIAESIFRSVPGNKELKDLSDVESLDYDLIFIGFPIYNFEPMRHAKEFIQKRLSGKTIAIFTTMALTSVPTDEQTTALYKLTLSNCRGCADRANLIGIFDCPGELSEEVANALRNSNDPQLKMFGAMRDYTIGFPNEQNIMDAGLFANQVYSQICQDEVNI